MSNIIKFIGSSIKPSENQRIYLAKTEVPLSFSPGKFKNGTFYSDLSDYSVICYFWLPVDSIVEYTKQLMKNE